MIKRFRLAGLLALALVLGGLGLAAPASAATPVSAPVVAVADSVPVMAARALSDCGVGLSCIWQNTNYGSTRLDLPWSTYHGLACVNLLGGWSNSTSSLRVAYGSGYGITFWSGSNCTGNYLQIASVNNIPDLNTLTWWPGFWNDQIQSFYIFI